jgi:hypothetical protein
MAIEDLPREMSPLRLMLTSIHLARPALTPLRRRPLSHTIIPVLNPLVEDPIITTKVLIADVDADAVPAVAITTAILTAALPDSLLI